MALIKCYECGKMVSDKAANCPKCGAPVLAQYTQPHADNVADEPAYMSPSLTFGKAIRVCLGKYATFTGRARRSEYWYFSLFQFLVGLVLLFIPSPVIATTWGPISILFLIYEVLFLLPSCSVFVRRLHDIGKNGWNELLSLVVSPFVFWIWLKSLPGILLGIIFIAYFVWLIFLLVWLCSDSSKDDNKYGSSPKYTKITPPQQPEGKHSDESSNKIKTSGSSMGQVKGVGKAHLEAMRALQEAKEQRTISEDVVQDIKNTHQKFLAKQERREREAVGKEEIASSIESRHVETAQAETEIFIEKKLAVKQPQAEMLSCNEAKENARHRREIIRTALLATGAYVVFLLLLLIAGYVSGNRGIRYYANGFYAWIGWQPFDDAKAFEQYPLIDLFSNKEAETVIPKPIEKPVEISSETHTMILDEYNYKKSFIETGPNGEEGRLVEFQCKLSYPKQIAGQNLHKLLTQMVVDCFGAKYAGQDFQ